MYWAIGSASRSAAFLHEHQHGGAGDRLGHRVDAEDRVELHRFAGLDVRHAALPEMHDLAPAGDERDDARQLLLVHIALHRCVDARQPLAGKPQVFWFGDFHVSSFDDYVPDVWRFFRFIVASHDATSTLHQDRVAPDAVTLPDAFAPSNFSEAHARVERDADRVLGQDGRLQRPDAGALGFADQPGEQRATDAHALSRPRRHTR